MQRDEYEHIYETIVMGSGKLDFLLKLTYNFAKIILILTLSYIFFWEVSPIRKSLLTT